LDPWTVCGPLVSSGLVEATDRDRPRSEWSLRVPPVLWDAARGRVEARPGPGLRTRGSDAFPDLLDLLQPPETLARLAKVPALVDRGRIRSLVLRCDPGTDAVEIHGAVARALGHGVLEVDVPAALAASRLGERPATGEPPLARLGPLCAMARLVPVLRYELGPGETAETPPLEGYAGPVGFVLGTEGGLVGEVVEASVTLGLEVPRAELRRRFWLHAADDAGLGDGAIRELDTISERFVLSGGYIRRLARIARAHAGLDGREAIRPADVRTASATLNRQLLDTLATHLDSRGSWSELVTAEATGEKLYALERRCRHRERLLGRLGPAFGSASNRGVRALFLGASGTGKTLAARVLAAELGMDLYRADLAAVINKYIGEPEKNLDRVLTRAEALDVVLLLDEGDALLGQRTEVKSSNDRYANLETNYLLQRLEGYQGIVLVTTNLADNIDPAFQRRMDVVVPFFLPQAEERWRILGLHLPPDHGVDPAFLEMVAVRCQLHGGQLRNAALHAALLALDEESPVVDRHLEAALYSEYRKAGGTCPLDTLPRAGGDSGLGAFAAALGGR
ncbi:MAG: ATP-binding protein, partial [Holophagales bacterium]|nr:ATP-binding protein [Holophagales bacterium]